MKQILLNSAKNNTNVNVELGQYVPLSTRQRSVPTEHVESIINHYELYLKERNSCSDYKMFFTIKPYMSNVLLNAFTEIVYNEGAINSGIITPYGQLNANHKKIFTTKVGNTKTKEALFGEGIFINEDNEEGIDRRYQLLRDTEYSHPELGGLTYHCGMDIFNNHYLRSDGFFRIKKESNNKNQRVYNTIEDFLIYGDGTTAKVIRETPGTVDIDSSKSSNGVFGMLQTLIDKVLNNPTQTLKTKEIDAHLFNKENINTVLDAFTYGIKEENGWLGFHNKAYLSENDSIKINKCLNNADACAFVDMYPDRTLFSFSPKINNSFGAREEYNWKWCLTYPFRNVYRNKNGNEFDFFNKDGIKIIWSSASRILIKDENGIYVNVLDDSSANNVMRDSRLIYFRTKCKHNLYANDIIKFTYDNGSFSLRVIGNGDEKGQNKGYYFYVSYDDLANEFGEESVEIKDEYNKDGVTLFYTKIPKNLKVSKVINNEPCQYYIREFKKINKQPHSLMNRLAFSNTIFNDNIMQIIYDENVNLTDLKDNLGRGLSEIFITFIKNNKGWRDYYYNGVTTPVKVEYSHCFGKITSGFNFECNENEILKIRPNTANNSISENFQNYNVRCLYNLENFEETDLNEFCETMGIKYTPPRALENDITDEDDVFYGDFVEFSPSTVTETVIEDIFHRFNTVQREMNLNNNFFRFDKFRTDEIVYDDFDFNMEYFDDNGNANIGITEEQIPQFEIGINHNGFRGELLGEEKNNIVRDNIFPEGYFYKPHYRVKLKEYSNILTHGYDTVLVDNPIYDLSKIVGHNIKISETGVFKKYALELNKEYSFINEDKIVMFYEDGHKEEYYVYHSDEPKKICFYDFNKTLEEIKDGLVRVFYKNRDIPEYAYYTGDGTGKYVWRELIKDTELSQESDIYDRMYANGAVYINTNINFYLRRQDPYGIYGLQYMNGDDSEMGGVGMASSFKIKGVETEIFDADYITEENNSVCEI